VEVLALEQECKLIGVHACVHRKKGKKRKIGKKEKLDPMTAEAEEHVD